MDKVSLVPRLSAQLFFARSKISKKKLGREPGNEARTRSLAAHCLPLTIKSILAQYILRSLAAHCLPLTIKSILAQYILRSLTLNWPILLTIKSILAQYILRSLTLNWPILLTIKSIPAQYILRSLTLNWPILLDTRLRSSLCRIMSHSLIM